MALDHSLEDFYNTHRLARWNQVRDSVCNMPRERMKDDVLYRFGHILLRLERSANNAFDLMTNLLYQKFYDLVGEDIAQIYPGTITHVLDRLQKDAP